MKCHALRSESTQTWDAEKFHTGGEGSPLEKHLFHSATDRGSTEEMGED
jgi:hypothetical protein